MGAAEELAAFGAQTDRERQESFETSTLALVLRQLGWAPPAVRGFQQELGPSFTWEWFNGELAVIPLHVGSVRLAEFNFEKLWEKPARHPITEAWQEFHREHLLQGLGTGALIFRCFGLGRLVATNVEVCAETKTFINVSVNIGAPYRVLPFADFFTPWKEERS